jgi:hypothetical protein
MTDSVNDDALRETIISRTSRFLADGIVAAYVIANHIGALEIIAFGERAREQRPQPAEHLVGRGELDRV